MKVIGITGGVGAGKSTVVEILQKHLNTVFLHCDVIAHDLMEPGKSAYEELVRVFGNVILNPDKTVQRSALYEAAFPTGRVAELNACVHPKVREYIESELERYRSDGFEGIVLIEAALLLEAGYRDICDEIWFVMTPERMRRERLSKNRGYSKEKTDSIMAEQSDEAFFLKNSDFVIYNDSSFEECEEHIMRQVKKHLKGEAQGE